MFLLVIILVLFTWALVIEYKRRRLIYLTRDVKVCDLTSLPLVGQGYHFKGTDKDRMDTLKFMGRDALRRGGMCMAHLGTDVYYVVTDPDIAEAVLKNCLEKGHIYDKMKILLGNGLATSPVSIWRHRRKIVTRVFSVKNLEKFVKVFSDQSLRMVKVLKEKAGADAIEMWPYLTAFTMDSVCETILGVQFNALKNSNHPFLKAFELITQLVSQRMLQPWLYSDFVFKMLPRWKQVKQCKITIFGIIDKIVKTKKEDIQSDENVKEENENANSDILTFKTIIEMLLQHHKGEKQFTNTEVREESLIIALAGNDTSAVSTGFILLMLAKHPDIQQKVFDELKEVFGDSDRPVEASDLPKLKYLEAVVKETLRFYPPVPVIVRTIDKDFPLPDGRVMARGTQLLMHIWGLHRNQRFWGDDADIFRPERFLTPLTHNAFMPFSYGPRNCVGYLYALLSIKTAISTLVRNFKILPTEAAEPTREDTLLTKFLIVMKDIDNFNITLKPRK